MILKLATLAAAVALTIAAPAATPTVLSNFLTFDGPSGVIGFPPVQAGGEDKLQDDSLSRVNDTGTPGLSPGDTIFGVLTLSEILASGRPSVAIGANSQVAILYAASVVAGPGGTLSYVANPTLLASTCGAVCAAAGLTPTSIGVFLSTTTPDLNPLRDPLNWDALGANGVTANFNGGNGNPVWLWEMTAGLTAGQQNFFSFSGDAILGGTNRAGLDITSSAFPATFLPVDVLDFAIATHLTDLTLDIGQTQPASLAEQGRGWTFRDQSTFYVNAVAVPEPGSLALMGLALAGIAGFARRKS